jgi:flagellar basal-body rod protein FlgB
MAAGLDGLAQRQQMHAENLANVDTPGYQARTVDFESTLRSAMSAPGDDHSLMTAAPALRNGPLGDAQDGSSFTASANGGPVDRYAEVQGMMNDNIRYRVLTQQVTNRLSELRSVLSETGRG